MGAVTALARPDGRSEASASERAALARATLARAELRTGARAVRLAARTAPAGAEHPVPDDLSFPDGLSCPDGLAASGVRGHPGAADPVGRDGHADVRAAHGPVGAAAGAALPGRSAMSSAAPAHLVSGVLRHGVVTLERPPLPVPRALEPLLPDGLRRGGTTVVRGATSVLLALLAAAGQAGAWAAVVGRPGTGLLAAAQAGVPLDRLALVPRPGLHAPTVLAALVDGMDVVVVGPAAALTEGDRRRLSARARDRGAVLLSTAQWPGAGVVLTAEAGRWSGVGSGEGRLRSQRVRVVRTGRGSAAASRALELTFPLLADGTAVDVAVDTAVEREAAAGEGAYAAGTGDEATAGRLRLVG